MAQKRGTSLMNVALHKNVLFYNNPCFTLKRFKLFFQSKSIVKQKYLAQHSIDFTARLSQEIGPNCFKLCT